MKLCYTITNTFWNLPILVLLLLIAAIPLSAQENHVPVFVDGTEGYKIYRIPALINIPGQGLLAFCEGRVNASADFGNIDIVLRKSTDNGKTWGPLQVVADAGNLQAGNPSPVLDKTDPQYPAGRLFLFYNTGNAPENMVTRGKGLREVWYKTSVDGGNTWSVATNITTKVHRPLQPAINAAYNFKEDWRSYANGPGHAIQLTHGKYKDRIFVAINHSAGQPQQHFTDYTAGGFYTDDHGKTFHLGDDIPMPGGNENMAVELSGNKLMCNLRNQQGNIKARIVAISNNAGQNWDTSYYDQNLPDPVCEGSILAIGTIHHKPILAFCNAADTIRRNNLTLRISFDEGLTWKQQYPVDKAPAGNQADFTAYSDITVLSKNAIGILYERDNYKEISFTIVKWLR